MLFLMFCFGVVCCFWVFFDEISELNWYSVGFSKQG